MHHLQNSSGKAQNGNTSDVNYWCFLGDCMAVMNTSFFLLTVVWFCSLVFCSPLYWLAECSQRKETAQLTQRVSSVKRHFMLCLKALNSYFVPTAVGEIEQRKCGQSLGSSSGKTNGNRYSSLHLILGKLNVTPPGRCVHLSLQGWAACQHFQGGMIFVVWPVAIACKERIG